MNPFDDFDVGENFNEFEIDNIFEKSSEAEQVLERAKQELYGLLKDDIKQTLREASLAKEELSLLNTKTSLAEIEYKKWQERAEKAQTDFENSKDFDIPKQYINRIIQHMTGGIAPGDKVYILKRNGKYSACPLCNGEKKITAIVNNKSVLVKCPDCDGYGKRYIEELPHIEEKTVTGVYLRLCFEKSRVAPWSYDNVYLDNESCSTSIKDIYLSKEEADAKLKEIQNT